MGIIIASASLICTTAFYLGFFPRKAYEWYVRNCRFSSLIPLTEPDDDFVLFVIHSMAVVLIGLFWGAIIPIGIGYAMSKVFRIIQQKNLERWK